MMNFLSLLKTKMNELKQGIDVDSNVDIGSMTTKQQWKKIQDHLKDAIKKGAKAYPEIRKIEKKGKGLFCPALILENIK